MRIAIYARFSSDLQDHRSLTDQIAMAQDRADREGWTTVATCTDAAISGSSTLNRPGLAALTQLADAGAIDAVVTESLDRLSRDLEDMAALHKRLTFKGIKIITLADGEVSKMHVGIKGLIATLYLDDLAQKTRRGQIGRVKAGRIPGGLCYGYDVPAGAEPGTRVINAHEAEIVRRIFNEYVAGHSPLTIAKRLNEDAIPGPRGGLWNSSTLNGSRKRANGILSNA
ncbi:MAG: recombinase family protein, partial [Pseudomonadota bacterium]